MDNSSVRPMDPLINLRVCACLLPPARPSLCVHSPVLMLRAEAERQGARVRRPHSARAGTRVRHLHLATLPPQNAPHHPLSARRALRALRLSSESTRQAQAVTLLGSGIGERAQAHSRVERHAGAGAGVQAARLCAQGSRVKNETVVLTVHDLGCSGAHRTHYLVLLLSALRSCVVCVCACRERADGGAALARDARARHAHRLGARARARPGVAQLRPAHRVRHSTFHAHHRYMLISTARHSHSTSLVLWL